MSNVERGQNLEDTLRIELELGAQTVLKLERLAEDRGVNLSEFVTSLASEEAIRVEAVKSSKKHEQ